ncbi:MAG: hypothetical protein U5L96_08405 [Owenweeksia sp.]|nr:hypothetical protein [Owenweeksia sp.]
MKLIGYAAFSFVFLALTSCQECNVSKDKGNPDRFIRLLNQQGEDLWFGTTARYNPDSVKFIHEREGELAKEVKTGTQSVVIKFPETQDQPEEIIMQLDSVTSHTLTYNTLVFVNNECEQEYTLSYVKLNGEQMCGSCGNTQFNDDRYINLRL